MRRILLLTQVLPYPADSGPKAKTLTVLKYLAERHDITLASFVRAEDAAHVDMLLRWCRAVHTVPMMRSVWSDATALMRSVWSSQPWLMVRDQRAAMNHLVDRLTCDAAFDVIYADQLNMAQYALRVPYGRKVLDQHNALWLLYRRLAATMSHGLRRIILERDWRLLREYEGAACRRFDAVLAVSAEDRAALCEVIGPTGPAPHLAPITLDGDELRPVQRARAADHILHIGTMYWPPNIDGVLWFVRDVLPILRRVHPDVTFDCVGARPPLELLAIAREDVAVNVTGYVDDVRPYMRNAAVMVVPLRAGGGMRVKILHALAHGMPIVTTSLGCEGIALTHGRDALIADGPVEFANAIEMVMNDRVLADRLGRNARALFESRYDYRVALRPLDDALGES